MTKERVYDEQIAPLMTQIIAVCQQHGIATLSTFAIPTPEDADLQCTTYLPDESGKHPEHHRAAIHAVRGGGRQAFAMTITSPKKDAA
jgi:hypothetical protein